jgi:hypothetical protein
VAGIAGHGPSRIGWRAAAIVAPALISAALAAPPRAQASLCGLLSCGVPAVSGLQATAVTPQSATITATVNPDGAQTQYRMLLSSKANAAAFPPCTNNLNSSMYSPTQTLQASDSPSRVSWTPSTPSAPAAGSLIPNTRYQLQVTASNSYGTTQSPVLVFRTPLMAPVAVAVRAAHPLTQLLQNPRITAAPAINVTGAYGSWQVAYPPYRHYRTVSTTTATPAPSVYPGPYGYLARMLQRNAKVRFVLPGNGPYSNSPCGPRVYLPYQTQVPSVSKPVLIEVLPAISLILQAEQVQPPGRLFHDDGFLDAALDSASGYPLVHGSYRGPPAFLYVRRGREYRRLATAHAVFQNHRTPRSDVVPGSTPFRFHDPRLRRYQIMVCARTQFIPNMGPKFRYRACGRRTLRGEPPAGSGYTTYCRKHLFYQYRVPPIYRFPLQQWTCSLQAHPTIPTQ